MLAKILQAVAIDEETLEAGCEYARRHRTTLSALVRELLRITVLTDRRAAVTEMFRLMDEHPGNLVHKP
ncbi:MAG: hypothetical protein GXY47_02070 [Acidobacteria bacterium]|nr:hypothetical protein [Acidobacteriota bacterium]